MATAGGPQRTYRAGLLRLDYLLLAALAVAALLSRFVEISRKSVWIDEAFSWRLANLPLRQMFDQTAQDKHPPFYYGVLHYWVDLFGNSEAALRAPSAIAGAATIVLLGWAGWRAGGWLLGVSAGLLLLLNSAHLAASQEARMYALVGFLSLAASVALASYISKPSALRFLAYAGLLTAAIYTHYSAMMVVGVHALLFAGYGSHELVTTRRPWILLGGLATVAFLSLAYIPWLSTFRAQLAVGVPYEIPKPTLANVTDQSRVLLGLDEVKSIWLLFALPLLSLGVVGLGRRWREPLVVCTAAIALVPVFQILDSIWRDPVFNVKQASPYTSGLAFVLALGLLELLLLAKRLPSPVAMRSGAAALVVFGIALILVMGIQLQRTYFGPPRQDWRSVAADVGVGPITYVLPAFQWQSLAYYRGTTYNAYPVWQADISRITQGGDAVPPDLRQSESLLIVQGSGRGEDVLFPVLERDFLLEELHQYAGGITLYNLHPLVGVP